MHKALYRKWRPKTFDDVCGQDHITSVLRYQVESGKLSHAYLFCGSRGTGKTTCAKLLAKAANCLSPVGGSPCGKCEICTGIENGTVTDVIEMDAASNNGVEDVRSIRDDIIYAPSSSKYRVYIIDEVHMLSSSAFNALLKTLEEPPAHAIFVLATTELQKLPATIISRCQRFDFRRIQIPVLSARLRYIAEQEGFRAEEGALTLISRLARGGMRDAISMLELCAGELAGSDRPITEEAVCSAAGAAGRDTFCRCTLAVINRDIEAAFAAVGELYRSSRDIPSFWQELIAFYRDILIVKASPNAMNYLDLTQNEYEETKRIAGQISSEAVVYQLKVMDGALADMQRSGMPPRLCAELALVRMMNPDAADRRSGEEALSARLAELEARVGALSEGGNKVQPGDQGISPAAQPGDHGVSPAVQSGVHSVSPAAQPDVHGVSPAAQPSNQSVSPAAQPVDQSVSPATQHGDHGVSSAAQSVDQDVSPAAQPDDQGISSAAQPVDHGVSPAAQSSASQSYGHVTGAADASEKASASVTGVSSSGTGEQNGGQTARRLTPAGYYSDIIADYDRCDKSRTELLRLAKAYRSDRGELVIITDESFIHMMLNTAEVRDMLLRIAVRYDSGIRTVSVEKQDTVREQDDLINEIADGAQPL